MKNVSGYAAVVLVLGAVPLLATSVGGENYDAGRRLYANKCQFCHGIRGDGKGPAAEALLGHPVDFTDAAFWKDDVAKKIDTTIRHGKEMMPAFDLKSDDITAITWYISHTFKKAPQDDK